MTETCWDFVRGTLQHGGRKMLPLLRPDLFAQQLAVDETVLAGVCVSVSRAVSKPVVVRILIFTHFFATGA